MGWFTSKEPQGPSFDVVFVDNKSTARNTPSTGTPANYSEANVSVQTVQNDNPTVQMPLETRSITRLAVLLGAIASIGGFMFGYESGQISGMSCLRSVPSRYSNMPLGFLQISDFLARFGQDGKFTAVRQGTIVSLLCAGTLVGCLASGWICDKIGRRYTISASAFFYIIGVIIEITSSAVWVQFAMGRFAAGLGIGALSTSVPMYQSESVPKNIRGAVVSSYQLLITLGIWTAYMVSLKY
jgi:MFS transporter, SP family, sugar:H+ symporter